MMVTPIVRSKIVHVASYYSAGTSLSSIHIATNKTIETSSIYDAPQPTIYEGTRMTTLVEYTTTKPELTHPAKYMTSS
jgi:hypothetical protein